MSNKDKKPAPPPKPERPPNELFKNRDDKNNGKK